MYASVHVCVPDLLESYKSLCSNYSNSSFSLIFMARSHCFQGKKKFDCLMRFASSIMADAAH